jgi:hypothetical protein
MKLDYFILFMFVVGGLLSVRVGCSMKLEGSFNSRVVVEEPYPKLVVR